MRSYVYLHRDPITNEVRYVGAGSKGRAWACGWSSKGGSRRGNRTKEHQAWLNFLFDAGYTMGDIVKILAQGLSTNDAHAIENEEILRYDATLLFNIQTIPSLLVLDNDKLFLTRKLREYGKSYAEIANEVGVSTMTVYRALNNQTKGYQVDVITD